MLSTRRREHLEMATLASALPQCSLLPFEGVSCRTSSTKSLMACRGRQELSYWRWARTLFGGHCVLP